MQIIRVGILRGIHRGAINVEHDVRRDAITRRRHPAVHQQVMMVAEQLSAVFLRLGAQTRDGIITKRLRIIHVRRRRWLWLLWRLWWLRRLRCLLLFHLHGTISMVSRWGRGRLGARRASTWNRRGARVTLLRSHARRVLVLTITTAIVVLEVFRRLQ